MAAKRNPGKRTIQKILNESCVDWNADGPMRIVADVGDIRYYVNRSIELLTQAKSTPNVADQCIKDAISLLALVRAKNT